MHHALNQRASDEAAYETGLHGLQAILGIEQLSRQPVKRQWDRVEGRVCFECGWNIWSFREKKKDDDEKRRDDKETREHRQKMEITPAERITHQIATKAKNGAFWFGIVAGLFAFAALAWNMWSFRTKMKDDDDKWREERRLEKVNRDEDKEEKKKEREEDKKEKKKEREEAREEAKKAQSAIDTLNEKVTNLVNRVTELENDKREQREKRELLERLHQKELSSKEEEIKRLKSLKETMQKCLELEPLPGWLPGSSGETWGQHLRVSS